MSDAGMIHDVPRPAMIRHIVADGEGLDALSARRQRRSRTAYLSGIAKGASLIRLWFLGAIFTGIFAAIAFEMVQISVMEVQEPSMSVGSKPSIVQRGDIVDRHGRLLASNMQTYSLYTHPDQLVDPEKTAVDLTTILPDLNAEQLLERFQSGKNFVAIRRTVSPEQRQRVHDLGEPGLHFGPRETRMYPNGRVGAHILGGVAFGRESTLGSGVVGIAGVEKYLERELSDPTLEAQQVHLSIDLTVQAVTEQIMRRGLDVVNAKAGTAILMDISTGEVIALASMPDFDPNHRPPPTSGDAVDPTKSPLFNHAIQASYELGSVFKIFTVAQALEMGLYTPDSVINTSGDMRVGGIPIREYEGRDYKDLTVTEIVTKSSNRGTVKIAMEIGADNQRAFLSELGFGEPAHLELAESASTRPLFPKTWNETTTAMVSFGYGIAVSPLQLAVGYASILNGGTRVRPTLLKTDTPPVGERVVSEETSAAVAKILRSVVTDGTASFGNISGFAIAGKTGTADKLRLDGAGYDDERVISTFASAFPAEDPAYVLITMFDEPDGLSGDTPRRSAGWTAVPVGAEIARRVAPLLSIQTTQLTPVKVPQE